MSYNHAVLPVPAEVVWAVLCDPRPYGKFVVGTHTIRWFTPDWPEVASELHHTQGFGPLQLRDTTTVVEVDPGSRLLLRAGLGPIGTNEVLFTVQPDGPDQTIFGIEERAVSGPGAWVWNPVFDAAMWLRNRELIRRMRHIVERRAEAMRHSDDGRGAVDEPEPTRS